MSTPLEDYALIGDCETAALVSRAGSIDWLCWPRFDSGACFAALLGAPEHGRWLIEPSMRGARVTRRYRDQHADPRDAHRDRRRRVHGHRLHAAARPQLRHRPTGAWRDAGACGCARSWCCASTTAARSRGSRALADGTLRAIAGPDMVVLHTPAPMRGEDLTTVGEFEVAEGETRAVRPDAWGVAPRRRPMRSIREASLAATEAFWTEWAARSQSQGEWGEAVTRSLITLKALTYAPTGGIVAAPTTSLPEQLGGARNWDYRYCWLRDATLTLLALMNAGYYDEARDWRDWLLRAAAGAPSQLQIMYGLAGERRLPEFEIPWLPGYEDSQPVRIGNAAHGQLQLDVYGEVMDALHQARRGGLVARRSGLGVSTRAAHTPRIGLAAAGRGDVGSARRGAPLHPLEGDGVGGVRSRHPRGRAVRSVWARRSLAGRPADDPRRGVRARLRSASSGAFVQSYGSKELDASLLLLSDGRLPAGLTIRASAGRSPPSRRTCSSTGSCCATTRARPTTGCRQARARFSRAASGSPTPTCWPVAWTTRARCSSGCSRSATTSDCWPRSTTREPRRLVGNFPQAFSHVALVNTAHNLMRATKPAEQRAAS